MPMLYVFSLSTGNDYSVYMYVGGGNQNGLMMHIKYIITDIDHLQSVCLDSSKCVHLT